jgi:hypothetical protein
MHLKENLQIPVNNDTSESTFKTFIIQAMSKTKLLIFFSENKFLTSLQGRLDLEKPIISGHSFGGVTAAKAVVAK